MAASFNKFNQFVEDVTEGVHNFASHTLKIMLTNSAPIASNTVKANLTEISAGNGYNAGGVVATLGSNAQTSGTEKLILDGPYVITASGGSIGPFRYVVLYNDTPTSPADPLIAWWDYGSSSTLADGETFTITPNETLGVLTLA